MADSPWLTESFDRFPLDPAVDIYETDEGLVVKAAVPGIKPENIDINIVGDSLTIKGEVTQQEERSERHYIRRERRYGSFARVLSIPEVAVDNVTAEFANGVLTILLPRPESAKPRTIEVKSK
jgi:HSP20 family protein